jgi:hypothetical protein
VELVVPEHLGQTAKSVLSPRVWSLPGWLSLPRLASTFVFDSLAGVAVEGARMSAEGLAHMIYHAGDYALELEMEREPESTEMALVGQLLNRADSAKPLSHAPVLLMGRNKVLSQVETSRFGEFCLMGRVQQGLKLCIAIADIDQRLEISLNRMMGGRR